MNAILRAIIQVVAYADSSPGNNPLQRYADWKRDFQQIPVQNPRSDAYQLAIGETRQLFSGVRTMALDGTSAFSVALLTGTKDHYRFTWTGGTNPVFRTNRNVDLSGLNVTVTVLANGTVTMARSTGTFSAVSVGDVVWVPTTDVGITSPFDLSNRGFWTVLAVSGATLTLERSGDFDGFGEVVAVTALGQFIVFASSGVQVGDTLEVSAGFASPTQRAFPVVGVTPQYIEVVSNPAVAGETAITPGAAGLIAYTSAKRFLHLEADQECLVLLNGDTGTTSRVSPWIAGDQAKPGVFLKTGPAWSLSVTNRAPRVLNLTVLSAE